MKKQTHSSNAACAAIIAIALVLIAVISGMFDLLAVVWYPLLMI